MIGEKIIDTQLSMKKVLFISDGLDCGGSEQSLVSLLTTLDYSKIDVDLLLRSRGGVFERYVPKEVKIIDFEPNIRNKLGFWLANRMYSVDLRMNKGKKHSAEMLWNRVEKYIGKMTQHYDVAIAFQQGFPTFYLATKVSADKKAARVNIDMLKANYSQEYCRKYYDQCDTVIGISDALSEQLKTTNYVTDKSKIMTVFNVFSVAFINSLSEGPSFEDEYNGNRIVTTGRLVAQKGYDLAIKAASILKLKGLDFRWYFIGDGEKRAELEASIRQLGLQENVILLGMQPNPYPFMKNCSIYVQTSLFEGFGRTVTEAKILHCPIVTTNFPSAYDQIQNGKNGLICEMNEISIAEKIMMLLGDTELRNKLVKNVTEEEYTTAISESKKVMQYIFSKNEVNEQY